MHFFPCSSPLCLVSDFGLRFLSFFYATPSCKARIQRAFFSLAPPHYALSQILACASYLFSTLPLPVRRESSVHFFLLLLPIMPCLRFWPALPIFFYATPSCEGLNAACIFLLALPIGAYPKFFHIPPPVRKQNRQIYFPWLPRLSREMQSRAR